MTTKYFIRLLAILFLFCATVFAQTPPDGNVIVARITGLHNDHGRVLCTLYSSADGFPKDSSKAKARAQSLISDSDAICEFKNVAPGTYAISVFHDENSNGKLDSKFLGMPREGVGASNDAKGHFGPPKFPAAAFRFEGGKKEMKIKIVYL